MPEEDTPFELEPNLENAGIIVVTVGWKSKEGGEAEITVLNISSLDLKIKLKIVHVNSSVSWLQTVAF